jgi:hypothetical protein
MRNIILLLCLILGLLAVVFNSKPGFAVNTPILTDNTSLLITEVMPDPAGDDSLYEWLEIQNTSQQTLEISDWKINNFKLPQTQLQKGEIAILARSPMSILTQQPNLTNKILTFNLNLANSGSALKLTDNSELLQQTFTYGQAQTDKSFELLNGNCEIIQVNPIGNSIGKTNCSCPITTTTNPTLSLITPTITENTSNYSNSVYISASSPCTSPEYIEIYNADSYTINLKNWILEDVSENSDIISELTIEPNHSQQVQTSKVTLNNSGDRLTLFDPAGMQKDIFVYPECQNKNAVFKIQENALNITQAVSYTSSKPQVTIQVREKESELLYPQLYR